MRKLLLCLLALGLYACSNSSSSETTYYFQTDFFTPDYNANCRTAVEVGTKTTCYAAVTNFYKTERFYLNQGATKQEIDNYLRTIIGASEDEISRIWSEVKKHSPVFYGLDSAYVFIKS